MRQARGLALALAFLGAVGAASVAAQTSPPPTPTPAASSAPAETPAAAPAPAPPPAPVESPSVAPTPAPRAVPPVLPTPVPTGAPPRRLLDSQVLSVSHLPPDNPFGIAAEEPAGLPPKPAFPETTLPAALFAAVRVDPTGKVVQSKIVRDPVPAVVAESKRSFEQRWSFDPAVKAGRPVDTWASLRLDLQVEVRPREEQATLTPVLPSTPLPQPFIWGDDAKWYETYRTALPADGTVSIEQVDTTPNPKKTKWGADSYKGPFSCKLWVKVSAAGRIEKVIPIQVSDPVLIPYMRRTVATWALRPARLKGQPVDSWNELSVNGQLAYSIDVKQINNLRKNLAGP